MKGLDAKKAVDQHCHPHANQNPGRTGACYDGKSEVATCEEIISEVVLNLHHSGFAKVLKCLLASIDGF